MLVRFIVILIIIKGILSCMDSLCAECISVKLANKVQQKCLSCQSNYVLNEKGMCTINIPKLLSLGISAIFAVAASLVVRYILIKNSLKKRKIYTADYQ